MASVQFYGKDPVIEAAENGGFPFWAIFAGRQLLFKYTGEDFSAGITLLDKILETISHSEATYTLKFFEKDLPGKKIKENTPCDGSFNFKLVEEEERAQRRQLYSANNSAVLNELTALRNELAEMRAMIPEESEDQEGEEKALSLNGIIAGLLKEPAKIGQLFEIGRTIFGTKQAAPVLSGIPETGNNQSEMEQQQKIDQAIEVLKKNDPKLGDHLLKLAQIAQNDPGSWKYLVKMLESR